MSTVIEPRVCSVFRAFAVSRAPCRDKALAIPVGWAYNTHVFE